MPDTGDRPSVLICEPIDPVAQAWLSERATVIACAPDEPGFDSHLAGVSGLVVRTYTRVDRGVLDRAPQLRVVGRAGVGLDNVDVAACRARGVRVVHTPSANTNAVVEYVFGLLLDAMRPRPTVGAGLTPATWRAVRGGAIGERELHGSTLGILGMGRIGRALAPVAAAFGMRVLYHDLLEVPEPHRAGASPVSFETLLSSSDCLTVHVDDRPENRHLLGADAFERLRPGVVLVNASRGFVIDHAALATFLRANPGAMASLDVHDPEPIGTDHPLLEVSNARLLPHLGAATAPAHLAMSRVVEDVWRVLSGE